MLKRGLFLLSFVFAFSAVAISAQESGTATARIRVANYVIDAPELTVTLDGEVITEALLAFQAAAPHVEVEPGMHDIAFGNGSDTILASAHIEPEAASDYTVALIGQVADESVQIVIIPETELVASLRDLENPASYAILLHGISNAPSVDFNLDGETLREGLTFGQFDVFSITQAPHDILVTFSDDPDQVLFENSGETPPANDLLLLTVMVGSYPDALDVTGAVSRLPDRSVIDFLRDTSDGEGSQFDTLLAALESTGLGVALAEEGVFTLFAPTDAAFDALPAATRDSLFADADALREVLLGHVVDEVFVLRDVTEDVTVTSRQGTDITLRPSGEVIFVNDSAAMLFGGFPVVTNGNVIGIDQVLLP